MSFDSTLPSGYGRWSYYYGPRWLPGVNCLFQGVISLASTTNSRGEETTVIISQLGLSVITRKFLTLEDKANRLQGMVYPRHDRFGLVSDCSLNHFGNVSSYEQHSND